MLRVLLPATLAACLGLSGCASTSSETESYERITQPAGSPAKSSGNASCTGPLGVAYELAATAVGATVDPESLAEPPNPNSNPDLPDPESSAR